MDFLAQRNWLDPDCRRGRVWGGWSAGCSQDAITPGWAEISTTEGSVEKEGSDLTLLQSDSELPITAPHSCYLRSQPVRATLKPLPAFSTFPAYHPSAGDETQGFKQVFQHSTQSHQ